MSKLDDLNQKLDALEAALANEKTEDEAKTAQIAALRTQLEGSLSAADADTLAAHIESLINEAKDVVTPDAPPAPAPTPVPDPNAPPA